MSDLSSFSEIGSVGDDFTKLEVAGEHGNEIENSANSQEVIIEMPPAGILVPQKTGMVGRLSQVSSIASSFVRGVKGLELRGESEDFNESWALASCEMLRPYKARKSIDSPSLASASTWSCVSNRSSSKLEHTSSPSSAKKEPESNLHDSFTTSPTYERASSDDSSLISIGSNFDIVSLSSGKTVLRCIKCRFHNHEASTVCAICEMALVANPCLDQDEQIARNLQAKEQEASMRYVMDRERKRERLSTEAPIVQATFFTEEIEAMVHSFDGFRTLPSVDLRAQAMLFIVNAITLGKRTKVSLAYVFTKADEGTFQAVRGRGFQENTKVGFRPTTCIAKTVDDAWKHFSGYALFSINEGDDEMHVADECGWLVAITDFNTDEKELPSLREVSSHGILPLVTFNANRRSDQALRHLMNGIECICVDFFEYALNIEPEMKEPSIEDFGNKKYFSGDGGPMSSPFPMRWKPQSNYNNARSEGRIHETSIDSSKGDSSVHSVVDHRGPSWNSVEATTDATSWHLTPFPPPVPQQESAFCLWLNSSWKVVPDPFCEKTTIFEPLLIDQPWSNGSTTTLEDEKSSLKPPARDLTPLKLPPPPSAFKIDPKNAGDIYCYHSATACLGSHCSTENFEMEFGGDRHDHYPKSVLGDGSLGAKEGLPFYHFRETPLGADPNSFGCVGKVVTASNESDAKSGCFPGPARSLKFRAEE